MRPCLLFATFLPSLSLAGLITSSQSAAGPRKYVSAHFMVGNTYPYGVNDWVNDIILASSKGFDAFALNVGIDSWQPARVADAYTAAQMCRDDGIHFKLFLSFDMTSLSCSSAADAGILQSYINSYYSNPNQLHYNGKPLVTTFAGENCYFGQGSVNAGWTYAVKTGTPAIYFIPSFFVDPSQFSQYTVIDGALNWNSAWPMGDYDIDFTSDNYYISGLNGKTYMATASPWFFTHYGPNSYNKNFIYRGDDWLLSERWDLLVQNRDSVDMVEMISWNDYGESHYFGPIEGAQPNSQAWTNGFDHQSWLDLIAYYIKAYKTGTYPSVQKDRIFMWGRLYPSGASSPDPVPIPTNWQYTGDYLWVVVLLKRSAQVTLTCGSQTQTTQAPKGASKLKLQFTEPCSAQASISRNGVTTMSFSPPGFDFSEQPPSYNFNAFVAASP